jgi:hypothetical protein
VCCPARPEALGPVPGGHQVGDAMDVQPVLRAVGGPSIRVRTSAVCVPAQPGGWRAPGAACIACSRRKSGGGRPQNPTALRDTASQLKRQRKWGLPFCNFRPKKNIWLDAA